MPDPSQELAPSRQRLAPQLALRRIDPDRDRDRRRELHPRHAGRRQHRLLVRSQVFDLLLDELPQRLRGPRRDVLHRPREPPEAVDLAELPLADQVVDRVHQEQRVAVRVPVERERQLRRASRARGSAGRDTGRPPPRSGTRGISRRSARAAAAPAGPIATDARLEATSAGRYVPRTSKRAASRRRASIRSRSMVAESLQCRSSSSSTSGASRARASSASTSSRSIRSRVAPRARRCTASTSWSLRSPGSCSSQDGACCLRTWTSCSPPGAPPQSSERLEHRQIRFARAVLLHALPAADAQRVRARRPRPGTPPPARSCRSPAPRSRTRAAAARRALSPGARAAAPARRPAPPASETRGRRRTKPRRRLDRADEPESSPVHRLDVPRRFGRIPERLAQIANAAREGGVAHDRVAPDGGEQLVLGDQAARVLDQVAQDRERPRRQREPPRSAPRPLVRRLDANRSRPFRPRPAHPIPSPIPRGTFSESSRSRWGRDSRPCPYWARWVPSTGCRDAGSWRRFGGGGSTTAGGGPCSG